MPRIQFTDLTIRALRSDAQVDYWDTKTPAFGIRVGKRAKTFVGKVANRRITIGAYPELTLAEARKRFLALKAQRPEPSQDTTAFGEALDLFLETTASRHKPSTHKEMARVLRKHFEPHLKRRRLAEITHTYLARIVDGLLSTPSEANHAFVYARMFFRWCVRRRYLTQSPLAGMDMPARSTSRERVLNESELASIWSAAGRVGYPFGCIVRMLILTGQRRGEIAALRWSWINEKDHTITFPSSITKNKRTHTIPYNGMVSELLRTIPRLNTTNLLFPAAGKDVPYSGWSKGKERLERLPAIRPWTLHDLRRTWASMCAQWAPPHVLERALNHVSGTISGVAAIYNRFSYDKELRACCDQFDAYLKALLART